MSISAQRVNGCMTDCSARNINPSESLIIRAHEGIIPTRDIHPFFHPTCDTLTPFHGPYYLDQGPHNKRLRKIPFLGTAASSSLEKIIAVISLLGDFIMCPRPKTRYTYPNALFI